jgi:hypothetical protein
VSFNPTAFGTATGTINAVDNASNSPEMATLSGVGTGPLTLSPSSLTFGGTAVGTTSASQPLSLKNNVTTSLGISITVSGPFSQTSNCPASLSASASCTINVTFAPITAGVSTGAVTVVDNVSNSATTATLSGNGTGGLVLTGSMVVGRYLHTATLLNNGKVLIAGGLDGSGTALASGELYDPTSGTFAMTGSMTTTRYRHTATLLNNGTVLITGGENNGSGPPSPLASAELYDPSTETFTATGSLSTSRYDDSATALSNGEVLIAGGISSGNTFLASAELYSPSTGTFTATGNMNNAREEHTATLLNNGKVLVAGGANGGAGIVSAELYDPATGSFTSTGSMNAGRFEHTATLLNSGKVLVAGGTGTVHFDPLASAELYEPTTGTFSFTGDMSVAVESRRATLLNDGTVLITGERPALGPGAEIYDSNSGTFTAISGVDTFWHTATLLNDGDVLIAGGNTSTPSQSFLYLPPTLTPAGLVSIAVTPATPTLSTGATQQFIATGTFGDNSTQTLQSVTWSSSSPVVATISNDASNHGVALAVAAGTTTVKASAGSITGSTILTVQ